MLKNLLSFTLFTVFATQIFGQRTETAFTYAELSDEITAVNSSQLSALQGRIAPFIALSVTADYADEVTAQDLTVAFFYTDSDDTARSLLLRQDGHADDSRFVSELFFLPVEARDFAFITDKNTIDPNGGLTVHLYNPGYTPPGAVPAQERVLEDCECPQPEFLDRLGWCPDGTCPEISDPVTTDVSHLVVHHSAGVNTSADWAASVRSIWDYHVNSNGWDDVGYNWLIDPEGVLYEGRGDNVRGAHFCGNNTNTQGVCMLGTYISDSPTEAAMTTLKEYLAWKSADIDVDPTAVSFHAPTGANVPNVAGHRDGCSTTCPGNALYDDMPQLITDIRQYQARICGHPHSVTDLELTLQDALTVNLTWTDNAVTEDEFQVQRAVGLAGEFTTVAVLPADTEVYSDTDLSGNTLYRYQVLSVAEGTPSACHLEAQITTGATTAVADTFAGGEVRIFPNPTVGVINLVLRNEMNGEITTEVRDLTGRLVTSPQITDKRGEDAEIRVDLTALPVGVYFVRLQTTDAEGTFRIVKQK